MAKKKPEKKSDKELAIQTTEYYGKRFIAIVVVAWILLLTMPLLNYFCDMFDMFVVGMVGILTSISTAIDNLTSTEFGRGIFIGAWSMFMIWVLSRFTFRIRW